MQPITVVIGLHIAESFGATLQMNHALVRYFLCVYAPNTRKGYLSHPSAGGEDMVLATLDLSTLATGLAALEGYPFSCRASRPLSKSFKAS